jgi:drug/metabolite transporter (DMT)-like permease
MLQAGNASAHRPVMGRICILAAAVLWSLGGVLAKADAFHEWPSESRGLVLAFWRATFAGLALLPAVRRPRWRPALVPMVASFTVMNVAYLSAVVWTTAANAIWLQSTAPLWVCLIGVALLGERLDRRDLVPLACGAAGVGLILWCELRGLATAELRREHLGVLLGLVAGVTYAAVVLCLRRLRDEDSAWLVAVNHLAAAAAMGPFVFALGIWPSGWQWPLLAALGVVQMGLPYLLFARGLRHIGSQEAAGIALLEPVLMPLWVLLIGQEQPAWWSLAGGGLILVGLAWRYGRKPRENDAARAVRGTDL